MSSAEIPQPHDGLIRYTFGSPGNACSLLQAYLPEALVHALDWQGLELQSGSYVDPELRQSESDLLYRVPVRADRQAQGAEEVFFHILLEHQSSPDAELRLRLLSYSVEILRRLRKERGRLEKAPVILTLVIAQVAGGWRISPQYADFVAWPDGLRPALEGYVPQFEHLLIDLGRESQESLRGNPEVRLALGLLKASAEKRLMEWLDWAFALMHLVHSPETLQVLFRYLASVESGLNLKEAVEKVRSSRLPQAERAIMTIAEELKAEGRVEGMKKALIGQAQALERVLGREETPVSVLAERSLDELQARIEALNGDIRQRLSQ